MFILQGNRSTSKFPHFTKKGLLPNTLYKANIKAVNNDTSSDIASIVFTTKCEFKIIILMKDLDSRSNK